MKQWVQIKMQEHTLNSYSGLNQTLQQGQKQRPSLGFNPEKPQNKKAQG